MRIHHLSAAAIPSPTANSIQVMKMSAALAGLGHQVTLFCRNGGPPGEDAYAYYGVPRSFEIVASDWAGPRGIRRLRYAKQVMRKARERGVPDVFYGRDAVSLAAALAWRRPVFVETHAPPAHLFHRYVVGRMLRSPWLTRLIVISDALRREYLRLFPRLAPERIVVAPNAADPDMPARPGRSVGGRSGAPRAGYAGHLYPGKGIEVIRRLADTMPHVDFHVIGGTDDDLARWHPSAARPNLLFHSHVPYRDIPGVMASFTIALAPYQHKVRVSGGRGDVARWMSPLKLFEYMAQAKAIVTSDLPVIREVLENGSTGLLCPPDDLTRWQAAIQRLIENPGLARDLGERARKVALHRHTWPRRARLVLDR